MNENQIRDFLAKNMSILEEGLVLEKKEKYIPSEIGTRSFIDLYAKDLAGHHVIIEIKRSDAAAREAIHEIYKYAESVKRHLAARDDEIRIFIVSTEWKELFVPFSSFVSDSSLSIIGLLLEPSTGSVKFTSSIVEPLTISEGRFIAPWHELSTYISKTSFERGLVEHQESCKRQGIENYVLVILKPHADFNAISRQQMIDAFGSDNGIDDYEFMIYLAYNKLTRDQCLKALSTNKEALEEALSVSEKNDDLFFLHNAVRNLEPFAHSDYSEIGYPAKFKNTILEEEKWEILSIERFGAFERNSLLTDDDIIGEICGSAGVSKQGFKRAVSLLNKAHISSAKNDIDFCLQDNPVWKKHITLIIDEASKEFSECTAEIEIFNPCAGFLTLYFYRRGQDDIGYIPSFTIAIKDKHKGNIVRLYWGMLLPDEIEGDFDEILQSYYEGSIEPVVASLSWGGYTAKDTDILEDAGFAYKTFKIDCLGKSRCHYVYKNDRWRSSAAMRPIDMFSEKIKARRKLCDEIFSRITPMDFGAFYLIDREEQGLKK